MTTTFHTIVQDAIKDCSTMQDRFELVDYYLTEHIEISAEMDLLRANQSPIIDDDLPF